MIMNTWIENMVHNSDLGIAPVPVIDNCLLQENIYLVKTGCYRVPELNSNQKAGLETLKVLYLHWTMGFRFNTAIVR